MAPVASHELFDVGLNRLVFCKNVGIHYRGNLCFQNDGVQNGNGDCRDLKGDVLILSNNYIKRDEDLLENVL